jgi:hypothetical protein
VRRIGELSLPFPRNLQHSPDFRLCSEKRPVRRGQILLQGDVGAVKYLAYGRNVVQQETRIQQGQRNNDVAIFTSVAMDLKFSGRSGRQCDRRISMASPVS